MNIYLTLDYELFMGPCSGSVQNCLIKPINRLIERTQESGVHFTIFVDAAYLYKLSELKSLHPTLQDDYNMIVDNLRNLVQNGHSIQLHIHPQWYFSTYKNNAWQIDQNHYKLSDIPIDKLHDLFSNSKQLLETIIEKKVTAYRAGGFSLQSLNNYATFLVEHGITADSSAASRQCYISNYQWYDYREIDSKIAYRFNSNISKEVHNGHIIEYPITSISISTIKYIWYRLKSKWLINIGKPYGDGKPVPSTRKINIFETRFMNYSFDYIVAPMLWPSITNLKRVGYEDVILLGHPKNQSIESIESLRAFILRTKDFATFRTI